ncbi:MAG: hypothetical protein MI923_22205 [Phycisphaerales bacterium]|nr:hypothetical protein [Phycisphaerales bacterium]
MSAQLQSPVRRKNDNIPGSTQNQLAQKQSRPARSTNRAAVVSISLRRHGCDVRESRAILSDVGDGGRFVWREARPASST